MTDKNVEILVGWFPRSEEAVRAAVRLAVQFHGSQVRKYTGEPYWHHPVRVAVTVAELGMGLDPVLAAILHDTLEDTEATVTTLYEWGMGPQVVSLVVELTDVYIGPKFGNRKQRKQQEARRLWGTSTRAQWIKAADMLDNTASITQHDPNFARLYMLEKEYLVSGLTGLHAELTLALNETFEEWGREEARQAEEA